MKKTLKFSKGLKTQAEKLAKLIALHCARNTFIEELHGGTFPSSKAGDFSDVKVVTPYGEIPWSELARISDTEMKTLNKEIVNKIFTFLLYLQNEETLPTAKQGLYFPLDWDAAEIDKRIKDFWNQARKEEPV